MKIIRSLDLTGNAEPTSRGMGAILKMVTSAGCEQREVLRHEQLTDDEIVREQLNILGTIGEGIDFDGEHQQELDDNE